MLVFTEHRVNIVTTFNAECTNQHRQGKLAVFVDADVHDSRCIDLILKPSSAVRNDSGRIGLLTRLVDLRGIVHSGRTDDLRNDDTLGTVDDEGTRFGHQGEITHKDVRLLDLARLLVCQTNVDLQGCGVVDVSLLALLDGILRVFIIQGIGNKLDHQIARIVGNGRSITKHLHESLFLEPFVGFRLDLYQIGQRIVEPRSGKAFSCVLTKLLIFYVDH